MATVGQQELAVSPVAQAVAISAQLRCTNLEVKATFKLKDATWECRACEKGRNVHPWTRYLEDQIP